MVFRYRVEFSSFSSLIGASVEFSSLCRNELERHSLDLFSNELMNLATRSDGMVFREHGTVTLEERRSLCDWVLNQPISGCLTLGYLVPIEESVVVGDFRGDRFECSIQT